MDDRSKTIPIGERSGAATRAGDSLPSYRSRYALIVGLLALLLVGVAVFSYAHVVIVSTETSTAAAHRAQTTVFLNDSFSQLYGVRRELHTALLTPSPASRDQLDVALARLDHALRRLARHSERHAGLDAGMITRALLEDAEALDELAPAAVTDRMPAFADAAQTARQTAPGAAATGDAAALAGRPPVHPQRQVEPVLERMQQRLDILRVELQAQTRRQVDTLSGISRSIGAVMFGALGLMLVLSVVGFLSLDRLILRPIRNLAENLKAHAHNPLGVLPRSPRVSETSDLVSAFTDMQAQVRARERELDHLAHHDTLTALPNRALFRRRLAAAIEAAGRHGMLAGLLFMDLDRFKQINDSYGHAAGDQMLVEISQRLTKVFRQEDLIARLGGDEFAVLLENLHERGEMIRLAEKALGAIQRPYEFGGRVFYSGASIGIAVAPDDSTDPDRLIQLADAAMYAAKRDDGSSFRFVSAELNAEAAAQHALENELREAVSAHRLELHFQPVVAVDDGHVHCFESLLRWPHAEQGMLRPASFMNALADAGLCSTISDWALDQLQRKRPHAGAVLSINLSARLLHDEDFAQRMFERIDEGRLVPGELILEITEDTLETDLAGAARVLHELKQRGVRIALDDFGTGQASLSHLRRFPFDYVKIDQSFVAGIGTVDKDEKLIQAIIRLAHALGMQVVAEGVETAAQRDFLAAERCDYIQGYLVGRPAAGAQPGATRSA